MPDRVQLSRARGWRMPPGTVKVDRTTVFGNPFTIAKARAVGLDGDDDELRALVVARFRTAMEFGLPFVEQHLVRLGELRGKNLACWCPPGSPCHADVLLDFANRPACDAVDGCMVTVADTRADTPALRGAATPESAP